MAPGPDFEDTVPRAPAVDALVLHAEDNVGTALRALAAGESIRVSGSGVDFRLDLRQPVPLCHKFALREVATGAPVIKYGETIGRASRDIAPGEHVHIHNLVSARAGRG